MELCVWRRERATSNRECNAPNARDARLRSFPCAITESCRVRFAPSTVFAIELFEGSPSLRPHPHPLAQKDVARLTRRELCSIRYADCNYPLLICSDSMDTADGVLLAPNPSPGWEMLWRQDERNSKQAPERITCERLIAARRHSSRTICVWF